jgi:hypothetical protein
MLRFITNAPVFMLRELAPFARGWSVDSAPDDSPSWATATITGTSDGAITALVGTLARQGYRFEGWKPRPATADPTFALAAARIERDPSSSAPAASWAR